MIINSFLFGQAYTARTTAFATATGITDSTILTALNTFDLGLISNSLDTKMNAIYPFVGGTASTHKYNFMDSRDLDVAFRLSFLGGWTHSSNGALPNGTNAYANTFLSPLTSLNPNSAHISYYSRTNISTTQVEMGVTTSNADMFIIEANTSGTTYFAVNQSGLNTYSDANSLSLYMSNRSSASVVNGWKNSTKVVSGTNTANITPSALPIFIGAWNQNTIPSYFSTKQCAFASVGSGLTDGEAVIFYNLIQAMQISLARNV